MCQKLFSFISIFLATLVTLTSAQVDTVVRQTKYGRIRGYSVPFRFDPGMHLDVFAGVPYIEAPIGGLRFKRPQEPPLWEGIRNATEFSPACPQVLDNIRKWSFGPYYNNTDEDCVYLNVYSPRNTNDPNEQYPVMVWIHGGSYRFGSGEEYDGRILAEKRTVVVTINYRLGVLGFLSTDDENAPGNAGLLDQVMALNWVKENIANFNGDPSRVTIFGNSAGGGSVGLHLFSPLSEGLFSYAIPQSGIGTSPWAIYRPPFTHLPKARELGSKNGCDQNDNQDLVNCLQQLDPEDLIRTSVSGTGFNAAWAPRVDNYFIHDIPETLLDQGNFHKVPLMTGTVKDEVSDEYTSVPGIEIGWDKDEMLRRFKSWSSRFGEWSDIVENAVTQMYASPGDDLGENRDAFFHLRADDGYIAPHHSHATYSALYVNDTYHYAFHHRSDNHPDAEWMGVPHAEELYYIFGAPFWGNEECPWTCRNIVWYNRQNYTKDDLDLSDLMMTAWANFAKTGNPNPIEGITWEPFENNEEKYMEITMQWKQKKHYRFKESNFWNQYLPKQMDTILDYCPEKKK